MRPAAARDVRLSRLIPAVVLAAACVVPVGMAPPPPGDTAAPLRPAARSGIVVAAVVERVNAVRIEHGLPVLEEDTMLNRAADGHARELAQRRRLDHESTTPELRTPAERVTAAGATWVRIGENLANVPDARTSVAHRVIAMWLDSPDHRRNLLGEYTHTGAGAATDAAGYWYVVQLYTVPAR